MWKKANTGKKRDLSWAYLVALHKDKNTLTDLL